MGDQLAIREDPESKRNIHPFADEVDDGVRHDQVDLDLRMFALEGADRVHEGCEPEGDGDRDSQSTFQRARALSTEAERVVQLLEGRLQPPQELLPGFGGHDVPRASLDEPLTHLFLETDEGPTDGRRGKTPRRGDVGKGPSPHQLDEKLQVSGFHCCVMRNEALHFK